MPSDSGWRPTVSGAARPKAQRTAKLTASSLDATAAVDFCAQLAGEEADGEATDAEPDAHNVHHPVGGSSTGGGGCGIILLTATESAMQIATAPASAVAAAISRGWRCRR